MTANPDLTRLTPREVVIGLALACISGLAVLAHSFGGVKLTYSAPFIAMPSAAILTGIILLCRKQHARLHIFAEALWRGAVCGLAGTAVYDVSRPLLKWIFEFKYHPFRAMPIFGMLITGRPETDSFAITVGLIYHFWNGISFGMMFALLRPKGGMLLGLAWGLGLQLLMMIAYPRLLQIRLADPGFLTMGIVGHSLWGLMLGYGLRRWYAAR